MTNRRSFIGYTVVAIGAVPFAGVTLAQTAANSGSNSKAASGAAVASGYSASTAMPKSTSSASLHWKTSAL